MLRNSRGSGKGSHSVSGTVLDQQGTITHSGYTRCGLQANIQRKLHKRLVFNLSNTLTVSKFFLRACAGTIGIGSAALLHQRGALGAA
jgi:hypothetical protein